MGILYHLDSWLHTIPKDVTIEKSVTQTSVSSVPEMRVSHLARHRKGVYFP